jgi:hypothetical protein
MPRPIPTAQLVRIDGIDAWYVSTPASPDQTPMGALTSYREGRLFKVVAAGRGNNLRTAKAAMRIAFERQ